MATLKFGKPIACDRVNTKCSNCHSDIPIGEIIRMAFPGRRPFCTKCYQATPETKEQQLTADERSLFVEKLEKLDASLAHQTEVLSALVQAITAPKAPKPLFGGKPDAPNTP